MVQPSDLQEYVWEWPKEQWAIYNDIYNERSRQDQKWGVQNHSDPEWSAVLGEEYGEVCQEVLRSHFGGKDLEELKKELIQVAAVAVAWLECIERR